MSQEERRAWIMLVVAPVGCAAYLTMLFGNAKSGALTAADFAGPMLWSIGGAILGTILIDIVWGMFAGRAGRGKDQRDIEIYRLSQFIGQSFVVIGSVSGLILAMVRVDQFWIANALYMSFVLSALLGSIAQVAFYRFGLSK